MDSDGTLADTRGLGIGVALGAGAWLFGYLLTYALAGSKVKNAGAVRLIEAVSGQEVAWKIVGWIFYNAHLVETSMDVPLFGASAVNFIAQSEGNAWVLYLLPPLVLFAVGAVAARLAGSASGEAGAKAGATLVPGYLVLSLLGALAFSVSSGDSSAGPNLLMAVFLAGLVYPTLFGSLGGAAAAVFAGGEASSGSASTG